MFSTDFSIADIFSPLDEDIGFLPRFNIGSERQSYMPVVHEKPRCLPPTPGLLLNTSEANTTLRYTSQSERFYWSLTKGQEG
jgi:hypothetical protein